MKRLASALPLLTTFLLASSSIAGIWDKVGIGFTANLQKLYGNHATGTFEFGGNPLNLRLNAMPSLFIDTDIGLAKSGVVLPSGTLSMEMMNIGFKLGYRFLPRARFNPLLYIGAGGLSYRNLTNNRVYDGYGSVGTGAEFHISDHFGLNLTADYRRSSGDDFDGLAGGKGTDDFFNVALGLNYYFRGRSGFDYTDFTDMRPLDLQVVNQIDESNEHMQISQDNAANTALLAIKRNQLLHSLQQRDKDIELLQAKLATLNEHADELKARIQTTRITELEKSFTNSTNRDSYLIHYRNALVLFQAGYHENAVKSFESLIQDNPLHPLAGNWLYWLGESYCSLSQFDKAVAAFKKAALIAESGSKNEMIQLMLGLSNWKAGNLAEAKITFERLLSEYPASRFEGLARDYLAELKLK